MTDSTSTAQARHLLRQVSRHGHQQHRSDDAWTAAARGARRARPQRRRAGPSPACRWPVRPGRRWASTWCRRSARASGSNSSRATPSKPIWVGCRWGLPTDIPPLALLGLPISPNICLQTAGQNDADDQRHAAHAGDGRHRAEEHSPAPRWWSTTPASSFRTARARRSRWWGRPSTSTSVR